MSSQNEVSHKSITLKIKKRTTRVNGKSYTNWEIRDTTSGKLVRHKRASLQEAREKAKEICEALAGRKREVIGWESHEFSRFCGRWKHYHQAAFASTGPPKFCEMRSGM